MSIDPDTRSKLTTLRRQYFQLVEPAHLRWMDTVILKAPNVQQWIYTNLFDSNKITSSPPERYQHRVLKALISKLEIAMDDPEEDVWMLFSYPIELRSTAANQTEISDDLMSALSSLFSANLPSESTSAQQKAFVTYAYPLRSSDDSTSDDRTVTLLESRSVISSAGTTGLRTWEAALLLGAFLTSETGRELVHGKNVLELGAGTGMISILCAKYLGVSGIVATDGDEVVVDAIKTNIFLNGLDADESSQSRIRTAALKWGWPIDASSFVEDYGMEPPNVLLGADVTYDKFVIPSLVSTLREFFELNSALQVLIAATIRNEQTFETFQNVCRRNGFSLEDMDVQPVPEQLQDGPFYPTSTPIQIWRITRRHPSQAPFAF
ncbi:hypothetical protein K469DRAFT_656402 [Zopfia rhizophila CBS 207.26]|uniref:Uncharacterized protein n=1 Tax=Zopfia rhizophila CBS 207.26 TaxID=1314779 RepID=A0A6A6ENG0_9PEZI|nr:hypothetical protein K469DRAFT_656402 [Zopfia rhizophila CBS 207.26]